MKGKQTALLRVQVLAKVFCSALSTGYKRTPWNPLAVRWALYRLLTRPSRTLCKPRNEPQFFQWKDFTLPDSAQTKMFWWCFLIKSFISIKRKLFLSSSEAPCAQWSTASREREKSKSELINVHTRMQLSVKRQIWCISRACTCYRIENFDSFVFEYHNRSTSEPYQGTFKRTRKLSINTKSF